MLQEPVLGPFPEPDLGECLGLDPGEVTLSRRRRRDGQSRRSSWRAVPLSAVADVELASLRTAIAHEDGVRTISVRLDAGGRSLEEVARGVEDAVAATKLPEGVYAEVGGEFASAAAAERRLLGLAALALIGILVLLLVDFGSLRLSLLALANVPLSLLGGLFAAVLFAGGRLSLGSIVGRSRDSVSRCATPWC
jgi:Cu/Ag efflux pump CusA